jgi:hypothetical protein
MTARQRVATSLRISKAEHYGLAEQPAGLAPDVVQPPWKTRDGQHRHARRTEAKAVAPGLEMLANDTAAYDADSRDPRFETIHDRAKQIFWNLELGSVPPPAPIPIIGQVLQAVVRGTRGRAGFMAPVAKVWAVTPNIDAENERKRRIEAERELKVVQRQKEFYEQQAEEQARKLNRHCKVMYAEALTRACSPHRAPARLVSPRTRACRSLCQGGSGSQTQPGNGDTALALDRNLTLRKYCG